MQALITCGGCGKSWSGTSRAHCAAAGCHEAFSCDSAAEKHRTGQFGVDRHCADPAAVGLVPSKQPWGRMWSHPGTPSKHWATAAEQPTYEPTADQWNEHHPVGTPVHAWPGLRTDTLLATRTRTPAWTLGHGEPVVSVDGYAGGIALDHIALRHDDDTPPAAVQLGLTTTT